MTYLNLLLVFGVYFSLTPNNAEITHPISISYVIFKPNAFDQFVFGKNFSPIRIDKKEVLKMEKLLVEFFKKNATKNEFKIKSVYQFNYQIIGAKSSKGKNLALVKWVCKEQANKLNWLKERLYISDGGPCFGEFFINLDDNKILSYSINSYG